MRHIVQPPTLKRFPIGISNYYKLITNNYYYVDKTLSIKEIYEDGGEVIIITRPRRFGKTLLMSMLHYFFSTHVDGESTGASGARSLWHSAISIDGISVLWERS